MAGTVTILNLGSGAHPLPNADNLDKENGWTFESGLGDYADESVEGVSVSHSLMHVALRDWPYVFSEFARVLEPGGVIRITEDATDDPKSERYGGFHDAVTLTSLSLVLEHLNRAGFLAHKTEAGISIFRDDSLIQQWHGREPKVFFAEGQKGGGGAGDRVTLGGPPSLELGAEAE